MYLDPIQGGGVGGGGWVGGWVEPQLHSPQDHIEVSIAGRWYLLEDNQWTWWPFPVGTYTRKMTIIKWGEPSLVESGVTI